MIFSMILFSTFQTMVEGRSRKVLQLNDIDIVPNFDCDESCQGRIERALPIAIIGKFSGYVQDQRKQIPDKVKCMGRGAC